jgi:putative membrane protein
MSWFVTNFLWIKVTHIIFFVSWMAGLLYLPRLFVYHCKVKPESEASSLFIKMERRLLFLIMYPSMIVTLTSGIILVLVQQHLLYSGWLHTKLFLVLGLVIYHLLMGKRYKAFATNSNKKSACYYRIVNEVPTLILILIVIMVILRPF